MSAQWKSAGDIKMKTARKTYKFLVATTVAALASIQAEAKQGSTVDTAIVLAVDNSIAVTAEEQVAQINAHVAALRSSAFVNRALSNDRCLGLHYLEWSGTGHAKTILPWTVICSAKQAADAAASIEAAAGSGQTASGKAAASPIDALEFAHEAMRTMPFAAKHKIINLSTVYPKEKTQWPSETHDAYVREGYTINAVAFVPDKAGMTRAATTYLKQHVIAGKGAFAVTSPNLDLYPKLLLQSMLMATGERTDRRVPFRSKDLGGL